MISGCKVHTVHLAKLKRTKTRRKIIVANVLMSGPLSVKVTPKSENRNRGIRQGRKPRAILRKSKTFNYVLHDLIKCWLKARTGCPALTRHSH